MLSSTIIGDLFLLRLLIILFIIILTVPVSMQPSTSSTQAVVEERDGQASHINILAVHNKKTLQGFLEERFVHLFWWILMTAVAISRQRLHEGFQSLVLAKLKTCTERFDQVED